MYFEGVKGMNMNFETGVIYVYKSSLELMQNVYALVDDVDFM